MAASAEIDDESYQIATEYVSESEEEHGNDIIIQPKAKRQHDWVYTCTLDSPDAAKKWIEDAGCWTQINSYDTSVYLKIIHIIKKKIIYL